MDDCVVIGQPSTGNFSPSGLKVAGRHSNFAINDTTWTAIPPIPLEGRNALAIQNRTGVEIRINYDPGIVGFVGISVVPTAERQYDVTDAVAIYAKSAPGSGTVYLDIEELA